MKTGAIIQARTSSTRLPAKVLKELPYGSGITVLQQVIRRVKQAKRLDEVVVATTTDRQDDAIVRIARKEKVPVFRGSLRNVLERYHQTARQFSLDTVVRITSDCPCIDPFLIDDMIAKHRRAKADYTSNAVVRSYPDGFDVEVFESTALETAFKKAKADEEREHVSSYIYRRSKDFKIVHVKAPHRFYAPERRLTLDTWEDYALLCAVYAQLYPRVKYFGVKETAALFQNKPWLELINSNGAHLKTKKAK